VLKDELTDEPAGLIDADGNTRETGPETEARVRQAFDHELLVRDGEVLEELGICFDGVCSIGPADPRHDALVLRNLGALTGLRPETRSETPENTEE
jgi:hypothetical protein